MTKRAAGKFKRKPRDSYDTPPEAVAPLLPFLPSEATHGPQPVRAWEPCAGRGALVDAIEEASGACNVVFYAATDIEPRRDDIGQLDALDPDPEALGFVEHIELIITNPPWDRKILHPFIERWSKLKPMWLLFDADWAHTIGAAPYLKACTDIVSVGRVSWEQNGTVGFDNCAWYHFAPHAWRMKTDIRFHGRVNSKQK